MRLEKGVHLLVMVVALLMAGCSKNLQMGIVENGMYQQPDGRFTCPLPGESLGFGAQVSIVDSYVHQKTQRYFDPNHPRAKIDGPYVMRPVGPATQKASNEVKFTDPSNPGVKLVFLFGKPRQGESRQQTLTTGFSGGNLGPLHKVQGMVDGYSMAMQLSQLPYFTRGQQYMDYSLWASFLEGDESSPDIYLQTNLVQDGRFISISATQPSLPFISDGVNPKDLEAVYDDLSANRQIQELLVRQFRHYIEQCDFSRLGVSS